MKRILKKIILVYIVAVLGFWIFYKISTGYFNPTFITKRDISMSNSVSDIKVKDFIEFESIFYILSEDNKVHLFNIYSNKIIHTFTVEGISNIEKLIVHTYRQFFYVAFLSENKVYLSKLNNFNKRVPIIKPKLVLDNLKHPIDIYMYDEYNSSLADKYQNNMVVLSKEKNKTVLNVYALKTKKLLEQLDAKINIVYIGNDRMNQEVNLKNIIDFSKINILENKTKRVFFNSLEIAPDNRFVLNLEMITNYQGSNVLSDSKNNTLWIKGGLWLFRDHRIILKKPPEKAYIYSEKSYYGWGFENIAYNRKDTKILVKYKNINTLEVLNIESSTLKKITDFSKRMYEALTEPFISLSYAIAMIIGSVIYS